MWATVVVTLLGFLMPVTFCCCIEYMETVISTSTGQPYIQIMYHATQSTGISTVLESTLVTIQISGVVHIVATSSSQRDTLMNSVIVTFFVTILLSLVNVVSTAAFNSMASLV
jgi:choline transport protein